MKKIILMFIVLSFMAGMSFGAENKVRPYSKYTTVRYTGRYYYGLSKYHTPQQSSVVLPRSFYYGNRYPIPHRNYRYSHNYKHIRRYTTVVIKTYPTYMVRPFSLYRGIYYYGNRR